MSLELIKLLDLPITATSDYGVVMGTEVAVKGKGICKGIVVKVRGLKIVENFLPMELGNNE